MWKIWTNCSRSTDEPGTSSTYTNTMMKASKWQTRTLLELSRSFTTFTGLHLRCFYNFYVDQEDNLSCPLWTNTSRNYQNSGHICLFSLELEYVSMSFNINRTKMRKIVDWPIAVHTSWFADCTYVVQNGSSWKLSKIPRGSSLMNHGFHRGFMHVR